MLNYKTHTEKGNGVERLFPDNIFSIIIQQYCCPLFYCFIALAFCGRNYGILKKDATYFSGDRLCTMVEEHPASICSEEGINVKWRRLRQVK